MKGIKLPLACVEHRDGRHLDDARSAAQSYEPPGRAGVIVTKLDGDARGGVALPIHRIIAQPIQFTGGGEKDEAPEVFNPERATTRLT